jgi:phosphatidylinositol glycan class B
VLSDRAYYGVWTLPPLRFLHFNLAQSLAVFYGTNRRDYYVTEGLPLLLTTALPFAVVGLWQAVASHPVRGITFPPDQGSAKPNEETVTSRRILSRLAYTSLFMTVALSTISHKEVRFLYPILPFLHVLAARPLLSCFEPWALSRKAALALLLTINLIIAGYTSQVHQRGVIDVLDYLRHKHETQLLTSKDANLVTTVGFLMPCHSTPWRSHLVHLGIEAWALTCEPPLDVPLSKRHTYLDEADQYYKDPGPVKWLQQNMASPDAGLRKNFRSGNIDVEIEGGSKRPWPQNVVFFEQMEPTMKTVLGKSGFRECWRGFNTHFHDDSRRVGDVIVWCRD